METVLKLDEGYQNGSAYLGLGQLYLTAPKALGGDTQKAVEYLEKGLRIGPNNALLRARLAQAYHAANRNGDAQNQIDAVLKMTPDPNYAAEQKDAADIVNKLAEKMKTDR
jgi:tetratricopeptide (TPR) repeat protein